MARLGPVLLREGRQSEDDLLDLSNSLHAIRSAERQNQKCNALFISLSVRPSVRPYVRPSITHGVLNGRSGKIRTVESGVWFSTSGSIRHSVPPYARTFL